MNDGQDVVVAGKIVSYRGGKIIVTTAPEKTRCGRPLPGKPACVNTTQTPFPSVGPPSNRGGGPTCQAGVIDPMK
ncbi:MAG: hypothetical protein QOC76_528 [Mycobacterium sp.]|jgi:hypothetical protein|nr:hypothetical protein [Mycobacterium sp.]